MFEHELRNFKYTANYIILFGTKFSLLIYNQKKNNQKYQEKLQNDYDDEELHKFSWSPFHYFTNYSKLKSKEAFIQRSITFIKCDFMYYFRNGFQE